MKKEAQVRALPNQNQVIGHTVRHPGMINLELEDRVELKIVEIRIS